MSILVIGLHSTFKAADALDDIHISVENRDNLKVNLSKSTLELNKLPDYVSGTPD